MRLVVRLSALALVALAPLVVGCGARGKPAAAPSEAEYDWSGFNGGKAAPEPSAAKDEKPAKSDAPAKQEAKVEKADKTEKVEKTEAKDDASAKPPEPAKKVSSTKIGGLSVSEVSADAVAAATQKATNRSVVSFNVTVGAEYEQLSVVLDNLAVQIVRPATSPDKAGPKVRSPKARKGGIAQSEAAYYDSKADVLVLVQADKKATSSRALAAIVGGGGASGASAGPAAPAKKHVRAGKPKRTS